MGGDEPEPAVAAPGKRAAARELLAPLYGWFTKGFDTPDPARGQGAAGGAGEIAQAYQCNSKGDKNRPPACLSRSTTYSPVSKSRPHTQGY